MFRLSQEELDVAKQAIEFHGIDSFYPRQPEIDDALAAWTEVSEHIRKIDLDTYKPYPQMTTYVLKDDKLVRPIDHLHVQDLLIYTALVIILRDTVEKSRLPKSMKKSFSYRAPGTRGVLYDTGDSFLKYRNATESRLTLKKTKFVTTIDLTDFFPRIYQHRLENALNSFAETQRQTDANRVLCKKLLPVFSGKTSYGIPTGPFASRVLAEAVLVDVDAMLADASIDFVRWMDDFTVFTRTREEGVQTIQLLTEWLHTHHGLSLNRAKTTIYETAAFRRDVWKTYDDEHEKFRELTGKLKSDDPYSDPTEDIGEDEVSSEDLIEVFNLALDLEDLPKYGFIRHLLERVIFRDDVLLETRVGIIKKAMERIDDLEPIIDSLAKAISREIGITDAATRKFCKERLRVFSSRKIFCPGHNLVWICWLVGQRKVLQLRPQVKQIADDTSDPAVKKQSLLCLKELGTRSDALHFKNNFLNYGPQCRLALIYLSGLLGKDERNFWKVSLTLNDFYEKLAFKS